MIRRTRGFASSPYGEFAPAKLLGGSVRHSSLADGFIENVKQPKTYLRVFHWKVCLIGTPAVKSEGNYFLCEQNLDKEEEAD